MKKIILLATGIALGFTLYGCGGKDPSADGGQVISLQDMAADLNGQEEIKDYLAQYPDSLQELSETECYVVLHGKEYSGREYLDSFMANVQTETADELVIVQFTVEGDPILIYLNYNAGNVYCVEDTSRDAWAGNGEKYFEKAYDSV